MVGVLQSRCGEAKLTWLSTAATNSGAATPLEIPLEDLRKSLEINTISVFALAQQAVGE